jgi:DNA-binding CsgD family transcriptional regulator
MSGHFPSLDREALRKLRRLAHSMFSRQGAALPMRELVELAHHARIGATGAGVTVDFEATLELAEPMIVVRVPARGERGSALLNGLTPREREIAGLVAQGLLNKQIAARLGVTTGTVKDHIHNVLEKTGLPNRAAVAAASVGHA